MHFSPLYLLETKKEDGNGKANNPDKQNQFDMALVAARGGERELAAGAGKLYICASGDSMRRCGGVDVMESIAAKALLRGPAGQG